MPACTVIGGGLAGCEAAWQLTRAGCDVDLWESKPAAFSPAHASPLLAELVCSNSLGSDDPLTAPGLLKAELRRAGSLVLRCADEARVPAGGALAVDRREFARRATTAVALEPRVRLRRGVLEAVPAGPVVVASGPLGFGPPARELQRLLGDALHFYDAIAPIVDADSVDMARAFVGNRWDRERATGEAAYVNCPLSRGEYQALVRALREGRKVAPRGFEEPRYFEGCLPVEVLAARGDDALAYGPLRPVGLEPPPGWPRPYAVLQLRPEDEARTCFNLVGLQTRLTYPEQRRSFRLVPALHRAEFVRLGSIHRNSYVDAPRVLGPELELRARPEWRLAGQVTGVEGYVESTAMGLLCGRLLAARLQGLAPAPPPPETALGALHRHVTRPRKEGAAYEPAAITHGLLPPLPGRPGRRDRRRLHLERALRALEAWLAPAG
ncbi:MAG: methylenetetrahydrofolate--tRNA-(uracil(54)-C(5))-methyltransferase (FADH(2)-oxidizing) TrmFO [Deltaproteobacteria bacterium]|nr:methylenetetrahydrofolate--tRNA-(uracil(54)-C(5))-methyltransferase (FADH(2)-oxidizing) TrmFO [Deltaproteobacteria bacterium]